MKRLRELPYELRFAATSRSVLRVVRLASASDAILRSLARITARFWSGLERRLELVIVRMTRWSSPVSRVTVRSRVASSANGVNESCVESSRSESDVVTTVPFDRRQLLVL